MCNIERQPCTIGVDIGTTTLKVIAYDKTGRIVSQWRRDTETIRAVDGEARQDVHVIVQQAIAGVHQVLYETAAAGFTPDAVCFSSAMHSLVLVDAENCALGLAYTWLDQRGRAQALALQHNELGKHIYNHTGTPIHAMSPLVKLLWLRDTAPTEFNAASRFVSIKEYLWYHLFGVWEIDVSTASASGLFDVFRHSWNTDALALIGIDQAQLSVPVPTTHRRTRPNAPDGTLLRVASELPYVIGSTDGVLSNVAADATTDGTITLTIGTSLAVRSGQTKPALSYPVQNFCYMLNPTTYIVGFPSNSGSVVIDWMAERLGLTPTSPIHDIVEAAGRVDAQGLLCLPYLNGERAPIWNESASLSMLGMRSVHREPHLIRSVIEGILFNARILYDNLLPLTTPPRKLVVSGHLFSHQWVLAMASALFPVPIAVQNDLDAATFGAAKWAAEHVGNPIRTQATSTPVLFVNQDIDSRKLEAAYQHFRERVGALY